MELPDVIRHYKITNKLSAKGYMHIRRYTYAIVKARGFGYRFDDILSQTFIKLHDTDIDLSVHNNMIKKYFMFIVYTVIRSVMELDRKMVVVPLDNDDYGTQLGNAYIKPVDTSYLLLEKIESILKPIDYKIFYQYIIKEKTQTEIGKCIGIKQVSVSKRYTKLIKKLRKHLHYEF